MYNYNYGGNYGSGCCNSGYAMPVYPCCGNNNNYAIILVLFILLVIVIGSRINH